MKCRHCGALLIHNFIDLGYAPPSNAYLSKDDLSRPEIHYPLKVLVCDHCWLVQTIDYASPAELFNNEYAYFSSTSVSWLEHAKLYTEEIIRALGLNKSSQVIEIASNDGYLLKNFMESGIPCFGIEPTESTAVVAEKLGITVIRKFFGEELGKILAANGKKADLIIGNNVYAHVPKINDFTLGLKALLKPNGTITLEFPHVLRLIENTQFDTIYHEHFSYLSLNTVWKIFISAGLRIWDVKQLSTHGGSLRVYGCHAEDLRETKCEVINLMKRELNCGLENLQTYLDFQSRAEKIKYDLLLFLIQQKRAGKKIGAYGAAAKGNTLLNYAGVKSDLLPFVCDAAIAKQGKFMPGSHIPIFSPEILIEYKLDILFILPWNISAEVIQQNLALKNSGVSFFTAVPKLDII